MRNFDSRVILNECKESLFVFACFLIPSSLT
jgi:hypothetical protein